MDDLFAGEREQMLTTTLGTYAVPLHGCWKTAGEDIVRLTDMPVGTENEPFHRCTTPFSMGVNLSLCKLFVKRRRKMEMK